MVKCARSVSSVGLRPAGADGGCPPHLWRIEDTRDGFNVRERHRCVRCGAEKETSRVDLSGLHVVAERSSRGRRRWRAW
jgi:hypothetical protein